MNVAVYPVVRPVEPYIGIAVVPPAGKRRGPLLTFRVLLEVVLRGNQRERFTGLEAADHLFQPVDTFKPPVAKKFRVKGGYDQGRTVKESFKTA
jgi:hypothetical protein